MAPSTSQEPATAFGYIIDAPKPSGSPLLNTTEQKSIANFFDQGDMASAEQPFSYDFFPDQMASDTYVDFFGGSNPFFSQHTQNWLLNPGNDSHTALPNSGSDQYPMALQDAPDTYSEDPADQAATLLQGMRASHERSFGQDASYSYMPNSMHPIRHASGSQIPSHPTIPTRDQAQRHSLPAQPIYSEHFIDNYNSSNDERVGANLLGVIRNGAYAALPVDALPLHDRHHFLSNGTPASNQMYDVQTQDGIEKGPLFDTEATIYATLGKVQERTSANHEREENQPSQRSSTSEHPNVIQADPETSTEDMADVKRPEAASTSPPGPPQSSRRKSGNSKRSRRQGSPSGEGSSKRSKLSETQKRANHTNSEQRRRDGMKTNLKELEEMVPALKSSGGIGPVSKATALRMTVIFLDSLVRGNAAVERIINEKLGTRF